MTITYNDLMIYPEWEFSADTVPKAATVTKMITNMYNQVAHISGYANGLVDSLIDMHVCEYIEREYNKDPQNSAINAYLSNNTQFLSLRFTDMELQRIKASTQSTISDTVAMDGE
jgi:hypothetical protein